MAIQLGDAGTVDHFGLAFQYQSDIVFAIQFDKDGVVYLVSHQSWLCVYYYVSQQRWLCVC